jgi:putative FmdB family regulatory protein
MPTYEYKCPSGHRFEKVFPTMNDQRRARCPTCGKQAERQISGGAGLVFKGSGFYVTDYQRAGQKQESKEGEAKPASEPASTASKAATPDNPKPSGERAKASTESSTKKKDSGHK